MGGRVRTSKRANLALRRPAQSSGHLTE